ncbi:MAG TPA: hypothetical protein PLY93_14730, partial [Turneriella sp.]|nr:hypothetical protein [Turneriella sp.]
SAPVNTSHSAEDDAATLARDSEEDAADKKDDKEEKKSGFKIPKPFFFNMYMRASAQDDFGYNSPTLGWSPFYGRLMNETPWMMADFGYHVVRP